MLSRGMPKAKRKPPPSASPYSASGTKNNIKQDDTMSEVSVSTSVADYKNQVEL